MKMILHARKRSQVGKLDFEGVYDLPGENVIIEEGEPVVTVISSGKVLENAIYTARKLVRGVYSCLNPVD